jgi:hypothetical protein
MSRRIAAAIAFIGIVGCTDSSGPPDRVQFGFREEVTGDIVRLRITNPAAITQANGLLASGQARWVLGTPRVGDGGFNTGYLWHLDPESISFAEVTIEACQTAASAVNGNLSYWIGFGQVCIWGVVEARES